MPTVKLKKKNDQIALLADRLAIALVVLKQRYGTDWDPWFREGLWDDDDSLGADIRDWPDYKEAKDIVRLFLTRQAKQEAERGKAEAVDA